MVLALSGTGRFTLRGSKTVALVEGAVLPPGATVCTDEKSYATVRLNNVAGRREQ